MEFGYDQIDPLAVIYNEGFWRISKVSPMIGLQYSKIKMKQYALSIRQNLVRDVPTSSNVQFTVTAEVLPMLKFHDDDPCGIMITVATGITKKEVYVAIFLSWGRNASLPDGVHLPYMLERGDKKIGVVVKNTTQGLFDCTISQYNFTQIQLIKFGFDFIENDTSRSSDPFILNYKTPQVNFKDKLTITFEIGDVRAIWKRVSKSASNPVSEAYHVLQSQIYSMLTFDITILDLYEISLPKAEVKSNGVVKMRSPENVNSVFTNLNLITHTLL